MVVMEEICEAFDDAEKITVIKEGNEKSYLIGSYEYKMVSDAFGNLTEGSRQMPALGVSLNNETLKAKKQGVWVEFDFGKVLECCGMPFEKLLFEVKEEYYGFNLIRYTSKYGYDGRCFYLDLVDKNMSEFYNFMINF